MQEAKERPVANKRKIFAPLMVASLLSLSIQMPMFALEPSTAVSATSNSEINFDGTEKGHEAERKQIESLLTDIESAWNAHDITKVMSYYSEDYINNDGLDKNAVKEITQDFWKTNPDAKSSSVTTQIRIEGNFATVESKDTAYGTIKMSPMRDSNLQGELNTVSGGQLYLKRAGDTWKITGDRIDYELVKVTYGIAKNLKISFTAPEQVKSGKPFSAKIDVDLPNNYLAVGSITNQALEYPQRTPKDLWRAMDTPSLERIINANTNNKNELLMATVIITDINKRNLAGIELLTRRLNVVPEATDTLGKTQTASSLDQSLAKAAKQIKKD
ncbi:MAG TPA: nuclear transport factor 2 family protein [Oculatellaceae cyanobacterium]